MVKGPSLECVDKRILRKRAPPRNAIKPKPEVQITINLEHTAKMMFRQKPASVVIKIPKTCLTPGNEEPFYSQDGKKQANENVASLETNDSVNAPEPVIKEVKKKRLRKMSESSSVVTIGRKLKTKRRRTVNDDDEEIFEYYHLVETPQVESIEQSSTLSKAGRALKPKVLEKMPEMDPFEELIEDVSSEEQPVKRP